MAIYYPERSYRYNNKDDDAENFVILYLENLCVVHIHIILHSFHHQLAASKNVSKCKMSKVIIIKSLLHITCC